MWGTTLDFATVVAEWLKKSAPGQEDADGCQERRIADGIRGPYEEKSREDLTQPLIRLHAFHEDCVNPLPCNSLSAYRGGVRRTCIGANDRRNIHFNMPFNKAKPAC